MSVLEEYCRAWRMWNSWLAVTERSDIEIESFIEAFTLIDHGIERGAVVGRDGHYDIEITKERIHVSFNGKPRYSWYPFTVGYGNLRTDDNEHHFRLTFGRN